MLLFHVSETRALDASPWTMDNGRLPMHHEPWTMDHSPFTIHHCPLMTSTRTTLTAT